MKRDLHFPNLKSIENEISFYFFRIGFFTSFL